jgi:DNA repair ATPase RecN
LQEKVEELRDQIDKGEKVKAQQSEHLNELKTRMDKLQQIADHYGIEVDRHEENKENFEKLSKELALLDKQKKIVAAAIDTMTKRYEVALNDKKKEYD